MKKYILSFLFACYLPQTFADSGFALSEHLAAGNQITLGFAAEKPPEKNAYLRLNNGLVIRYAHILSLGDLYGVEGKAIALGSNSEQQIVRFKAAFATLAESKSTLREVALLNQVIANELAAVEKAMAAGVSAEDAYKKTGNEVGRQINCITGGGCSRSGWWLKPGRYLKLAMTNYDHFAPYAKTAYLIGHQTAMKQAIIAHQSRKRADLELAYAMDAFACHYLSDLFSAGHLRTPRLALQEKITPALAGSLLANYMHNEENRQGLPVHNNLGQHWQAYGDFSYFNPANQTNRECLTRALQNSADDIFQAYYHGYPASTSSSDLIPIADEYGKATKHALSPLFYWDAQTKKLMRRKKIGDIYNRQWTDNWWGWSTLLMLKKQYGLAQDMKMLWHQLVTEKKATEYRIIDKKNPDFV